MANENTLEYRREITAAAREVIPAVLKERGGQAEYRDLTTMFRSRCPELADDAVSCICGGKHGQWSHGVATAVQSLKRSGVIVQVRRGVWSLGAQPNSASGRPSRTVNHSNSDQTRLATGQDEAEDRDLDIHSRLLRKLASLTDKQFEELIGRVLVHLNYEDVNVVGRSGDGGIDVECCRRLPLIQDAITVACQVKRHMNSVGPNVVGDLRGRWAHRADRLVLVNLGGFTAGAKEVAQENGAKVVTLVSGEELADLMANEGVGVRREPLVVETVDETFFSPFASTA